jgi:heavy metal sensor kinase
MMWNSFRVRLTLWNVAVLALVLGGFGLAFCVSIQSWMSRSIDRDLAERVQRHWDWERHRRFGPPGPPGGPGGPRDRFDRGRMARGMGPPDGRDRPGDRGPRDLRPPGPPGSPREGPQESGPRTGLTYDPEAQRRASFYFPRTFDMQGKPFSFGGPRLAPAWDPGSLSAGIAGRMRYSTVNIAGDRVRVLTAPRYDDGRIIGAVQVAGDLRGIHRLWRGQVGTLLILLPLALLVAGIGGLFLTERALRPVHQVTQAAAQIGAEDLSRRLKVTGRDELAMLAQTFNGMIGRLEAAFEQQRRFTADASHELRTPLARIKVSTSMALAGEQTPEDYQTSLRIADQAADVMERLIQQLMLLARADAGQLQLNAARLDLREVLQEAVTAIPATRSTSVFLDLPPEPLEIDGDADHLERVFINLLENALRYTPAKGQVTVWARPQGGKVVARVIDTGEGIAGEHLPHLGERFYRVDAARTRKQGGTGLGLAICQSIVEAHKGSLTIESEVGKGTTVTVRLPAAAAVAADASAARQADPPDISSAAPRASEAQKSPTS